MRFVKLSVKNWRNFEKFDIGLQNRVFIVGPNASGKSNFLDVFRFLRDVAENGLKKAVDDKRGGVSKIRCLSARRYPDIVIHASIQTEESEWSYDIAFSQDNIKRPIVKREIVKRDGAIVLDRPNDDDKQDKERLTQTHLEQVNANKDFREIWSFFKSINYWHIVPQLVREPDRSVGKSDDPYGSDFLERFARIPEKTRESRLGKILKALQVAVPQLIELELKRDNRGVPHLHGRYEHWRPRGAWQGEDQFSDGTLRLIGLLWSAFEGRGPLLLEEPELSLHPAVVKRIPQILYRLTKKSGRQTIISTHSSELLQDEGIAPDEVIMITPDPEGAKVESAKMQTDIMALLDGKMSMADAVLPKTAPRNVQQLSLIED
jgi:predicted ATPase